MLSEDRDLEGNSVHSDAPLSSEAAEQGDGYKLINQSAQLPKPESFGNKVIRYIWVSSIVAVVVSIAIGFLALNAQLNAINQQYAALNSEYQELNSKYAQLSSNFDDLQVKDSSLLNQTLAVVNVKLNASEAQIASLSQQVLVISNHSNVQVLAKMEATKIELNNNLERTRLQVEKELNSTIKRMNVAITSATETIFTVQNNVTNEMTVLSGQMQKTIEELNQDVVKAQENINSQVETIQTQINTYIVVADKQFAAESDFVRFQLAGTFTLLACLISMWHVSSHVRHYYQPDVQRRVMAVLWMVPIYSVTSWLSLVLPKQEYIFSPMRDIYESYVVYTFVGLLIAVLEEGKGERFLIKRLKEHIDAEQIADSEAIATGSKRPTLHLVPTCSSLDCRYDKNNRYSVAEYWLFQCRLMVMQFVFLKPLFSILPFILTLSGYNYEAQLVFENSSINWESAKIYIIFLENVSVATAFYGLLKFYHGTEEDLAWCDPWPKFLCIKGVVFMTFWQGFFISLMSSFGYVDPKSAAQIQNLLICMEMLIASLAHYYIFPHYQWEDGYREKKEREVKIKLVDTLAVGDFFRDASKLLNRKPQMTPDSMHGQPITPADKGEPDEEKGDDNDDDEEEEEEEEDEVGLTNGQGDVEYGLNSSRHRGNLFSSDDPDSDTSAMGALNSKPHHHKHHQREDLLTGHYHCQPQQPNTEIELMATHNLLSEGYNNDHHNSNSTSFVHSNSFNNPGAINYGSVDSSSNSNSTAVTNPIHTPMEQGGSA